MGKVDDKKKQKKDTLLKAAFDLFTEQGITKTSISEIVGRAGVAKGTFYLYFKDKYDLKNKLISHKASQIFTNATAAMEAEATQMDSVEDKILFIADHVIDQLTLNKTLLNFISKNLSWGVFKNALTNPSGKDDLNFYEIYEQMLTESTHEYQEPEILLFLIVELVGSSCHDSILYNEPAPIQTVKPYILSAIRNMLDSHMIS